MSDSAQRIVDVLSTVGQWAAHVILSGALAGAIVGILPFVFGLPAFIYYSIMIYEKQFIQNWLRRRRKSRAERLRFQLEQLQKLDNL